MHFVHDGRFPMDVPGVQSAFKRPVSFPVFAQFKPPFMFGPLNKDPVDPGRVPGDICVNCVHQNNFGVGSNNDAFSASNSFSSRRDSSNSSGFRKVKNRRCVCRTCETNTTYSRACSGVILSKFWICGHFGVSIRDLSFFLFQTFYGPFWGLAGYGRFAGPSTLAFRVQDFLCHIRDVIVRTGLAPKERRGSCPVKMFARPTGRGINGNRFPERTRRRDRRKDLFRHIKTVCYIRDPANSPLPISVRLLTPNGQSAL